MTNHQFDKLMEVSPHNHSAPVLEALRLVLVQGLTTYKAAQQMRIDRPGLSRALRQFPAGICSKCHQAILPGD